MKRLAHAIGRRLFARYVSTPYFEHGECRADIKIRLWDPLFWLWLYWPWH